MLSSSRNQAEPAITSLRQALLRISELEASAAYFRQECQAYDTRVRDLQQERDEARALLTETVRSIVMAQCLPHDLPAFCFGGPDYPTLTPEEQAMIAEDASPGLIRVRDVLRLTQQRNTDLHTDNYFLRSNLNLAQERIEHLEGTISRLRGGPDYTARLEQVIKLTRRGAEPYTDGLPHEHDAGELQGMLRRIHNNSSLTAIRSPYMWPP